MDKLRNNGGQGPANEQYAALPTLVSLDSMDIFGVPEMPTQQETMDSIYNKFVAPQKNEPTPARKATRNVHKRTSGGATPVGSNEQHHSQESNMNPMQSKDAPAARGGITSSPKHVPVRQQQPAWRQGSQDAVAKSPSSGAQSPKADVRHKGHQRNASQHSVLARRPRESSLKMKARMEATVRQHNKEAGRISRAGSAVAAEPQCDEASASGIVKDQQLQHIDAVQASGEVKDLTLEMKPPSNFVNPAESNDADSAVSEIQPQQVQGIALPEGREEDITVSEHEENLTLDGVAMSQDALANPLDQDIQFVKAGPSVASVHVSTVHEKSAEGSIPSVRTSGSQQAGKEVAQRAIDPKSFISRLLPRINVRTKSGNSDIRGSRNVPKAIARPEQKNVSRWCCFQK